ncbi:hypothetical protein FGADI_8743 [Fusarium gaditjirri]|uniref:Uncharacterized protein n=1 Tax=Fusarium gaditjirri TaxID=282569 RepID=A0A8H4T1P3_9HYPO|nr:hypothetical protein FGADI_8743 [Fusarium gaditjirri]
MTFGDVDPSNGVAGPSRPYKNIAFENVATSIEAVVEADKRLSQPYSPGQRRGAADGVVTPEEARRMLHEDMQILMASPHPHRAIRPRMPMTPAIHDFLTEIEKIIESKIPPSECDHVDEMFEAAMKDMRCWDKHGYYPRHRASKRGWRDEGRDKRRGEDAVSDVEVLNNYDLADKRKRHLGIWSKAHYKNLKIGYIIESDSEAGDKQE